MITVEMFEKEPDRYIGLREDGAIVVNSIFEKKFNGDLKLLLLCCEDHIYRTMGDGVVVEQINYTKAIQDYRDCKKVEEMQEFKGVE